MVPSDRDESVADAVSDSVNATVRAADCPPRNDVVDQVMLNDMVRRVLNNLTPLQADVFTLRALEGEDFRQIADQIGSSPGAARFVYHSARRRLQKHWTAVLSDAS